MRRATGFDPESVSIPKRFAEVVTWKGPIDEAFLMALKREYATQIAKMIS